MGCDWHCERERERERERDWQPRLMVSNEKKYEKQLEKEKPPRVVEHADDEDFALLEVR